MKTLWTPSDEFIRQSNLQQFEFYLETQYNLKFQNYESFWQWSSDHIDLFWESIWQYFNIINHGAYTQIVDKEDMPGAKWFAGSTLNYAEHIFRQKTVERSALIFANEREEIQPISWDNLTRQVQSVRSFLVTQGIQKGDCVVGYLPNIPETIVSFLAVNSLGAIWSCCSMDFGTNTVVERFGQINPKVLIAANGYYYKGKSFNTVERIQQIAQSIPSIKSSVLIPNIEGDMKHDPSIHHWADIITKTVNGKLCFEAVPFDHPIWILFSSGTTGKPKAITHSHGGVLLEHLKYLTFHNDVKKGENFFWFTTTGWMMWNFLQASLLVGATPVLFEGSPGFPDINVLWRLAEKLPIHHFGTSAPYLTALMNKQLALGKDHELKNLRSIGSTGAPLPPDAFEYIYNHISPDVWLCSMSGGTDVCTAFVGGVPNKPVFKGRIQGRSLGCSMKAYNDQGISVTNQLGEMVIEKPMPSMPIYFWNDPDDRKYKASYFEHYPGKWRHGDYIKIYEDGSLIIQGRSDSTLNRKGIRIGTAEIYNALNDIAGISEALILNLEKGNGDDIMPLFVVLEDGKLLTDELKNKINETLKSKCSPRHVPDLILQVPDIPYTLSGKKMEVPIKKLFMGLADSTSLNPEAIRNPNAMRYFAENVNLLKKAMGMTN